MTNDASKLGRSLVLYVGNCANRRPSFRLTLLPVTPAKHRVKDKQKRAPFPSVSRAKVQANRTPLRQSGDEIEPGYVAKRAFATSPDPVRGPSGVVTSSCVTAAPVQHASALESVVAKLADHETNAGS